MRKFALAGLALVLSVGLTLAAEVTFLSYDKEKKELKVKDGDDEKTYEVTTGTKFKQTGKDGDKDIPNEEGLKSLEKLEEGGKAKGKYKMDVEVDGKKVKEIKTKARGKKKDKGPDKN